MSAFYRKGSLCPVCWDQPVGQEQREKSGGDRHDLQGEDDGPGTPVGVQSWGALSKLPGPATSPVRFSSAASIRAHGSSIHRRVRKRVGRK